MSERFDPSRIIEYEGPLREVFIRESKAYDNVGISLNDKEFEVVIECISDFLPEQEYTRINFIDGSANVVALHITRDELELEKMAILGGQPAFETIFSKPIYQAPELGFEPEWSIKEVEALPEQAVVKILSELDPRVGLRNGDGQQLRPTLKPAKEIAKLIAENLKVSP